MLDHGQAGGAGLRAAALAALALVLAALGAGEAAAACGSAQQAKPRKDVSLGRAPLAIGDSPMLLALPSLAQKGYRANARGCRQYPEGLALMRELRREGKLPRLVVIALGSNGSISKRDIHRALHIAGKKRILGLATPRELGGGAGHDATLVRREAHRHKRIRLLDWVRFSSGHPGWFQPDGLHLTLSGAEAMARLFDDLFKLLIPPR